MTEQDGAPQPPDGLLARGRRFWDAATAAYDLGLDELELLAEIARELDTAEELAAAIGRDGLIVRVSTGQLRVNPAVAEVRASRQAIGRLLAQLGLPDEDDEPAVVSPLSARGRKGASTRWAKERDRLDRPLGGGRRGA